MLNSEFRRRQASCVLVPLQVKPEDLDLAFSFLWKVGNFDGLVLTVPHKIAALGLVDELQPEARLMGAVNAVRRRQDGRLVGGNFDGIGFLAGLRSRGHDVVDRRVLIVGCGGAGTAIASAIAASGARELKLCDQDLARSQSLSAQIKAAYPSVDVAAATADPRGMDVVVNCTSLGMKPNDPLPVDISLVERSALAVDIVLEPEITPFLAQAQKRGIAIHSGPYMLSSQIKELADFFEIGL